MKDLVIRKEHPVVIMKLDELAKVYDSSSGEDRLEKTVAAVYEDASQLVKDTAIFFLNQYAMLNKKYEETKCTFRKEYFDKVFSRWMVTGGIPSSLMLGSYIVWHDWPAFPWGLIPMVYLLTALPGFLIGGVIGASIFYVGQFFHPQKKFIQQQKAKETSELKQKCLPVLLQAYKKSNPQ